jgi:putative transposase
VEDVVRVDLPLDFAQPLQCRGREGVGQALRRERGLEAQIETVQRRANRFPTGVEGRRRQIMRAVCADFETELVEFNGENNHVHLLVNFPPKVAPAKLVNSLKGVSSRRMRQEFPDLAPHYYQANKLWSGSYFAGSAGGAPLSIVKQYIEQQNRPV